MSLPPLVLTIEAAVSPNVRSAFADITGQSKRMAGALGEAQARTEELQKAIAKARQAKDVEALARANADLANHLNSAAGRAVVLGQRLSDLRDKAAAVGAAGAAGLVLANSFIEASKEASNLEARLEAILKAQNRLKDKPRIEAAVTQTAEAGHFSAADTQALGDGAAQLAAVKVGTDDLIAALPRLAAMARATGKSVEESFENFGEGYRNVSFEDLEELGVYFSDAQKEDLEKTKETLGQVAGQAKFMAMFLAEADSAAGNLGGSISATAAAANDADRAAKKLQKSIGQGSAESKAVVDNLLGSVLRLAGANEEAGKSAGKILYVGSMAAAAVGGVVGLGAQVALLGLAFPELKIAAVGAFGALRTAAASTIPFLLGVARSLAVPFAILTAGVAVGVAGYEALRAAGAFGPDQKSAAEIYGDVKKMLVGDQDAAIAQANTAAAAVTASTPTAATPVPASTLAAPSALATVPASTSGPSTSSAGDIEALEDAIAASSNKYEKAELQEKLRLARRAQSHASKDEAARKREATEAEQARKAGLRDAGLAAGATAEATSGALDERGEELRAGGELADARDRRSLLAQVRIIKSHKDEGDEARIDALRSLYDARAKARQADLAEQIASLEAQKALAEAGAKASGLEGTARDAALRIGQARANRLRAVARARAEGDREEARDAEREARERLREVSAQEKKPSGLAAMFAAGRLRGSYDGSGGLATAGGGPFSMRAGDYGGGPAFTGNLAQRAQDAASSGRAFRAFGLNEYGEDPRNGGSRRGQGSYQPQLKVAVGEILRDLLGRASVPFTVTIDDGNGSPGPLRSQ